jgi:arabinofuranosyltransferase
VTTSRRDDLLVVAGALLALALYVVRESRIAGGPGLPLDDSWIHLHFARNLAEGAGFSYNPGVPVSGSTAPLWTLLLAGAVALWGASVTTAKALGVTCALAAALVVRRAALAWGAPPAAALVAAVALLWSGPFAWGALSGMEVTLAALLVAAALLSLARGRAGWTALWGALAVLARPEALLLVPLLFVARRPTVMRAAVFVVCVAAALTPVVIFSYATVGAPYPATAAAKIEGGLLGWLAGVREPAVRLWLTRPWQFAREWVSWLFVTHWLLPLAIVPGIPLAWRRHGAALGMPALVLAIQPLGMALLAPYRGPAFQEGRYSIHLLPIALVVLASTLGPALQRRRRAALLVWLVVALVALVPAADRYAWGVQNINAMQVHLGHWVDARLPRGATLALNDIGAIAYFSRRPVIDLMGLVTPDILPYRRAGEPGVLRYVEERCPDYVIIFPTWFPSLVQRGDLLERIYAVRLERVEVSGGPEMVVYRVRRCAV